MKFSMNGIKRFTVPKKSLSVWWLGQASFLVKSPNGVLAAIDPYLSDSCGKSATKTGINCHRLYPPPMPPRDLAGIDLCVLTHSHQDHFDPETIKPYLQAGGTGPFLAPAETVQKLRGLQIGEDRIILTWPNKTHTIGDLTFRTTFAIPYDGDDLTHVGYLISVPHGPTLYFTGDTAYEDVLGTSVAEHKPDVMFTVINGIFRNLSPADAARLANQIKPKVVIPYHYDLFPISRVDPDLLKTNLRLYHLHDRYRALSPGRPYTYPASGGKKK